MKFLILSDIHNEFSRMKVTDEMKLVDVVILAGDISTGLEGVNWAEKVFSDLPVVYVPGNHEYYGKLFYDTMARFEMDRGTNVRVLMDKSIRIGDIDIFGCTLWTDMELHKDPLSPMDASVGMTDYRIIKGLEGIGGVHKTMALNAYSKAAIKLFLSTRGSKTIVVTHNAPSLRSSEKRWHNTPLQPAFVDSGWDDYLDDNHGPDLWLHGHIHTSSDYMAGRTRVVCNPRGYIPHEPNKDFNPLKIVEI